MDRLGKDFIKDMKLEEMGITDRGIACEMLYLCLEQYEGMSEVDFNNVCYADDVLSDETLVNTIKLAGYWSNDLAEILMLNIKANNIKSPLLDNKNPYTVIHDWLKARGFKIKEVRRVVS